MKLIYYFMKFILLLHKMNTFITINSKTKTKSCTGIKNSTTLKYVSR